MEEAGDIPQCTNATMITPVNRSCNPRLYNYCTGKCYSTEGWLVYYFDDVFRHPSALFTYGYVYPFLLITTLISNVMIMIVLSRKHMRTPTNLVLLYMAVADLAVGIVPFPFIFHYTLLGNYRNNRNLKTWWCYMALYLTDALPPFCHNCAIWLTVLLAFQRFIYVRFPLKARVWCTITNVNLTAFVIIIFCAFGSAQKLLDVSSFQLLRYEIYSDEDPSNMLTSAHRCVFTYTSLVLNVGVNAYFNVYYWSRVINFTFIPSIFMVVLSVMLISGLQGVSRRRQNLLKKRRNAEARSEQELRKNTLMLVLIVIIFLVVNLPQGILLALFCISQSFNLHLQASLNRDHILLASNIDNMLILATYPLNFAIYCSMSAEFRRTFKTLLRRWFCGLCDRNETITMSTRLARRSNQNTDHQLLHVPALGQNHIYSSDNTGISNEPESSASHRSANPENITLM